MKLNLGLLAIALQATAAVSAATGGGSILARGKECARQPYGCSKDGYCWKTCGQGGEWCWSAYENGTGSWKTCGTAEDCNPASDEADKVACATGGCDTCGCSC
ncbi:hypothetical protein BDW42DRAFT_192839 [Aspergillus taichungensis]|uniref:Uncharacterized protein n=1 Tax=Aspergillus taichungensis TaxID=482145 RepID=A0A2J5HYY8_9EURO|nr:hypothetical protein BDW42DRAFT_192839 [Aspergillus taichungensis]